MENPGTEITKRYVIFDRTRKPDFARVVDLEAPPTPYDIMREFDLSESATQGPVEHARDYAWVEVPGKYTPVVKPEEIPEPWLVEFPLVYRLRDTGWYRHGQPLKENEFEIRIWAPYDVPVENQVDLAARITRLLNAEEDLRKAGLLDKYGLLDTTLLPKPGSGSQA